MGDPEIPHPMNMNEALKRSVKESDRIVVPVNTLKDEYKKYNDIYTHKFNPRTGLIDFKFNDQPNYIVDNQSQTGRIDPPKKDPSIAITQAHNESNIGRLTQQDQNIALMPDAARIDPHRSDPHIAVARDYNAKNITKISQEPPLDEEPPNKQEQNLFKLFGFGSRFISKPGKVSDDSDIDGINDNEGNLLNIT